MKPNVTLVVIFGVAIFVVVLLSRQSRQVTVAPVTGPSEATTLALIGAGVETQAIQAQQRTSLASIFVSGLVSLTDLDIKDRATQAAIASGERIRFQELRTVRDVAEIGGNVEKYRADAAARIEQIRANAQTTQGIFGLIGSIIGALF